MFRKPVVLAIMTLTTSLAPVLAQTETTADPNLWLEAVDGKEALEWVKARNAESEAIVTTDPRFEPMRDRLRTILDDNRKLVYPVLRGAFVDNFWQDASHVRGIWRRTSWDSFLTGKPEWRTILDIDALGAAEGVSWVWKGATCLEPEERWCMVMLSRGGGDATVQREFDSVEGRFVEGGFLLPEAKSSISWRDRDTLLIATDFGPGSLTDSGYPRIVRSWRRGSDLAAAPVVFEGKTGDVGAGPYTVVDGSRVWEAIRNAPTFFTEENLLAVDGTFVRLPLPIDANMQGIFQGRVLVSLRTPWSVGGRDFAAGALVAVPIEGLLAGKPQPEVLFEPNSRTSLAQVATASDKVVLSILDTVRGRLETRELVNGTWTSGAIDLPANGSVGIVASSASRPEVFATYTDFLTPPRLVVASGKATKTVQEQPAYFATEGLVVSQHEATSKDGTKIPYFLVTRKDAPAGPRPTLLYGYGGFEVSLTPTYSATMGAAWLEQGGTYVLANIRGGGEFGPAWHQAALREKRHKAFEDFIAVGEDLVARGITEPKRLGIMGGSNGGLLVGAAMTQRPDLFGAVVCQVPLLDMARYAQLLAGASWIDEYGDPADPKAWDWIKTWSPYQQLKPGVSYPHMLLRTSTRDDRVHPGHARKMAAKLRELGQPVDYWENIEGGHGGAADNRQRAFATALDWTWLAQRLELGKVATTTTKD